MIDGFLRVAAATPAIRTADCAYNAEQILGCVAAAPEDTALLVFPELCLTGYTCGDLFLSSTLLAAAEKAMRRILSATVGRDTVLVIGLPVPVDARLFNCAAVCQRGILLGLVPKVNIPNYTEFYEQRWFTSGRALGDTDFCIPFGKADIKREGTDVTIVANLLYVKRALEAADELARGGISAEVIDAFSVKPLDEETILASVGKTGCVAVAEEHSVMGGLGSAVAETLARELPTPVEFVGMRDAFGKSGEFDELMAYFNLDAGAIVEAVKNVIARKQV